MIDNSEGLLAPALKFKFFELLASVRLMELNKVNAQGRILMSFSYFNPLPCKWEPFVEKSGLSFDCVIEDKSKVNLTVHNSRDIDEINFNISEQLVRKNSLISPHIFRLRFCII